MSLDEKVLCVPREDMIPFSGFLTLGDFARAEAFKHLGLEENDLGLWVSRRHCEDKEEFKQVIPYVILRCDGKVALFRRTVRGEEVKLHRRMTIGVGGHVDLVKDHDEPYGTATHFLGDVAAAIRHCVYREIIEEVGECEVLQLQLVGLINVEENAGRTHVGLVYDAELSSQDIGSGDGHIALWGWLTPDALWGMNVSGYMEEWSEAIVNARFKPLSVEKN